MRQQTKLIANFTLSFVLTILLHFASQGQTQSNIELLRFKMQSADSIVLISHDVTIEYGQIVPDWDIKDKSMNLKKWNKLHPLPLKYLDKGKLNRKIIKESVAFIGSGSFRRNSIPLLFLISASVISLGLRAGLDKYWIPAQQQACTLVATNGEQLSKQ